MNRRGALGRAMPLALVALCVPSDALANLSERIVCTLATTQLNFGEYVPYANAPLDLTATITVTCSTVGEGTVNWAGMLALNGASLPSTRKLSQGNRSLDYRLYSDPARTRLWGGQGNGLSLPISGSATSARPYRANFTVYGRIPARQVSAAASGYSDRINVILDYEETIAPTPN